MNGKLLAIIGILVLIPNAANAIPVKYNVTGYLEWVYYDSAGSEHLGNSGAVTGTMIVESTPSSAVFHGDSSFGVGSIFYDFALNIQLEDFVTVNQNGQFKAWDFQEWSEIDVQFSGPNPLGQEEVGVFYHDDGSAYTNLPGLDAFNEYLQLPHSMTIGPFSAMGFLTSHPNPEISEWKVIGGELRAVVSEPPIMLILGTGLIGLIGLTNRKKA